MADNENSPGVVEGNSVGDSASAVHSKTRTIRILVEVGPKEPPVKLEFDTDQVTGRTIKERAGVPLDNDLARHHGQKLELVTNDQTITIANGDRFISLPPGTIS